MKLKCNQIIISSHAKGRLSTRCPGMKMGTARSKIQHKIAEAQRRGVKTDWDGAVQIKFWKVPALWAICYALLEGGWAVTTIFREGWIDDMEECERYGLKTEEVETMAKIDFVAYEQGRYAASQYSGDVSREKNPYPQGSDKWLSWNRGWRDYLEMEGEES